jgi:signal recognition particle subunit SRP54
VNRFFEARKMMKQRAGQFGFGGGGGGRRSAKNRKGKKGGAKGKGKGGRQRGALPALPDLSKMPAGLNQVPPGLAGLDELPAGFDPSKLKLPKSK